MTATVRLDDGLEDKLSRLSVILNKKKSDIIRDAISFYAAAIEKDKKSRILKAIEKTKDTDKNEFNDFEGTFDDGI
ncbi:MAG: CopG family transcriptional regulator [Epsilonproteobacteria bacterium]|nr:CopG family transcriptional regulator [Campylobacterota bacterium]